MSDEELLTDGKEKEQQQAQQQVEQRRQRHEDVKAFNKTCVFPLSTLWPCGKLSFVSSRAQPNTKSVLNPAWSTPQVRCMFSQKFAKPAVGRPKMVLSRTITEKLCFGVFFAKNTLYKLNFFFSDSVWKQTANHQPPNAE